jgi:hypothetical protein
MCSPTLRISNPTQTTDMHRCRCLCCLIILLWLEFRQTQEKQCKYNLTLRSISLTIVAVGKQEILHILSACLEPYPTSKAHRPNYIFICGLFDYAVFFHNITQRAQFSGKKFLKVKYMFWFSLQLWNLFVTGRIQRDVFINVQTPSSRVPLTLSDFNEIEFS